MSEPQVTSGAGGARREPNARVWFALFSAWLVGLTIVAQRGLAAVDAGSHVGLAAWLLALFAFYLSLCCLFVPAPTTWIVLLCASDAVAADAGVVEHRVARVIVVATIGALATGLANLNEYHLIRVLLRFRPLARMLETRTYTASVRWFETNPFGVLMLVSLLPIPIDVVRWLAIGSLYPRGRYFLAYFLGRFLRYALLAVASMGLRLGYWHIGALQGLLILMAAVRVLPGLIRHARSGRSAGLAVASAAAYDPQRGS